MRTSTRTLGATVLSFMLLVGAFAGASLAQEADDLDCPDGFVPDVDANNYPVCVEADAVLDDSIVRDDEEEEPEVARVVVEQPESEDEGTVVLGVTLARTGGELITLLIAGTLLLGLGVAAIVFSRRRRTTVTSA